MRFAKMSGAGNDFVLLDLGSVSASPSSFPALARRLCDRRWGVGADGLLLVDAHPSRPRLLYFNSDGSRAFCGNGARCAAWWIHHRSRKAEFEMRTESGLVKARVAGRELVAIAMPQPRSARLGLKLKAAGRAWTVHAIDTGVPHAVVEVKDLEGVPVLEAGRALRRHRAFQPAGANVNFMRARAGKLAIRTYERGVEAETLACGTGATASALIAALLGKCSSPASVAVSGGRLTIRFKRAGETGFKDVWLEGPARIIFTGELS